MYLEDKDVPKAAFTDLPQRAVKTISLLKHHGILNGKSKTKFCPNLDITRGEAAIMLYSAYKEKFPPIEEVDSKLMFQDVSGRFKKRCISYWPLASLKEKRLAHSEQMNR